MASFSSCVFFNDMMSLRRCLATSQLLRYWSLFRVGLVRYHFFRTDTIRYQQFWVSTDTDPIPTILSICRYRYRSDTNNSEYLPIPIRYQQFWVSADTDTDPIPTILSIYRYRSDKKILSICQYRYRSDTWAVFLNQCIISISQCVLTCSSLFCVLHTIY